MFEYQIKNVYQNIIILTTFIIDSSGRIDQKIVGPMSKGTLQTVLSKTN